MRPRRLVLVVGTGTDVGKTWVSAHLLATLRAAGLTVAARKPAQSFDPADDPGDIAGFWHDYTVEALTRRGVKWFICTEALHTASRELAQLGDGDPAAIFADLKAHLLPGALVVPSGSQALVIAQERHYTYQAA